MNQAASEYAIHDDLELVAAIRDSVNSASVVRTTLSTDQRVIARVTDGIYRQPGSALRELISNAYDADATRVVMKTDAPRFERIVVEDDGHGMSPEAIANLIRHIGGSAKRNEKGGALGVTSKDDPSRSPGGRKLIGKIGIGLFSVSQLTRTFQIITKVKGDAFRTVATVSLRQYSDDDWAESADGESTFEAGKVNIWREPAADTSAHGTTIVLNGIRPQARDTLRSRDIWSAVEHNAGLSELDEKQQIDPPKFHIGRVDGSGEILSRHNDHLSSVPWGPDDDPDSAFRKLVDCVWAEISGSNPNPQLERIFDNYLRTAWQLSLAVPVPYVQSHVFDMSATGWLGAFLLSNRVKGAAEQIQLAPAQTVRDKLALADTDHLGFEVLFDNLRLQRPVKFKGLPATAHALKEPIVFVGKCREEFEGIAREISGGPLEFEAYLIWTPKVAPTEHQGSLIRIHGSSGTLFDPTFMRYQVSEQTRLRQITCEIYVREGLESALNIDRESFNNAHPHVVYLTKWLHSALRQLATTQKRLAAESRAKARGEGRQVAVTGIQGIAAKVWEEESNDAGSQAPLIQFVTGSSSAEAVATTERYVFKEADVLVDQDGRSSLADRVVAEKVKAIAQILAAFGLMDVLSEAQQTRLLKAISQVINAPEG